VHNARVAAYVIAYPEKKNIRNYEHLDLPAAFLTMAHKGYLKFIWLSHETPKSRHCEIMRR